MSKPMKGFAHIIRNPSEQRPTAKQAPHRCPPGSKRNQHTETASENGEHETTNGAGASASTQSTCITEWFRDDDVHSAEGGGHNANKRTRPNPFGPYCPIARGTFKRVHNQEQHPWPKSSLFCLLGTSLSRFRGSVEGEVQQMPRAWSLSRFSWRSRRKAARARRPLPAKESSTTRTVYTETHGQRRTKTYGQTRTVYR